MGKGRSQPVHAAALMIQSDKWSVVRKQGVSLGTQRGERFRVSVVATVEDHSARSQFVKQLACLVIQSRMRNANHEEPTDSVVDMHSRGIVAGIEEEKRW